MTKRDFDSANKLNYGTFLGARSEYRAQLGRVSGRDRLAERAAWRKRNPDMATLAIASQYRAPTEWRLMGRFPRLA
jgi:hypothetical protein